jgi:hypothetical protein
MDGRVARHPAWFASRVTTKSSGDRMRIAHFILYIDPGSGSLLLQVFLAAGLGIVAAGRKAIWRFLSRLFGRPPDKE